MRSLDPQGMGRREPSPARAEPLSGAEQRTSGPAEREIDREWKDWPDVHARVSRLGKGCGVRAEIVPRRASDLLEDRRTPNTLAFEAATRGLLVYER